MNYHLVIEYRPKDFMPIDINILQNNRFMVNYKVLQNIDNFTRNYSEEEIMQMIKTTNIVPEGYLKGKLTVINDNKYRYEVFTKNYNLSLDDFLKDNIDNKQIMNKLINIFNKYNDNKEINIKDAIINKNINSVLQIIFSLSYEKVRNIYFYINNNIIKSG